jgi:hypothetical protein
MSVTLAGEFYFSSEDAADAGRVGKDGGNADEGDDEHDAESFVGGGGVVQNDEGDPETLKVTSHMRHHQVQRSASFLTNKLSAPTPRSKPSSMALPNDGFPVFWHYLGGDLHFKMPHSKSRI